MKLILKRGPFRQADIAQGRAHKKSAHFMEEYLVIESLDYTDTLLESEIQLQTSVFPSGNRDFTLVRSTKNGPVPLNSLELLKLDRAVDLIEKKAEKNEAEALNLALCRLLVPCLRTSRVGRHLVVEPWTEAAIRGDTLAEETHSEFARELSQSQADQWRVVKAGGRVPDEPLESVFWDAVTELPHLESKFDDPLLGELGKELYFKIVPDGTGRIELEGSESKRIVESCLQNEFRDLDIECPVRERRKLFRKYMAVTVRWTSKLTGQLAQQLVDSMRSDTSPLSSAEQTMLNLRYGAAEHFGKINVGYLSKCDILFQAFFNDIFRSIANGQSPTEQAEPLSNLLQYVFLYRNYRVLRKHARREEKHSARSGRWEKKLGSGRRMRLDDPVDREPQPIDQAVELEAQSLLLDRILPELERKSPRHAKLLRLYIDYNCDLAAASKAAGLELEIFERRLLASVLPAAKRVASRLGYNNML